MYGMDSNFSETACLMAFQYSTVLAYLGYLG